MPQNRRTIWVGEPIEALLAERRADNVSGALSAAVARYREVCRRHLPRLTVAEWCAIFDALNGCWMLDSWSPPYLFAEVHDSPGLGDKWGIDQAALVQKLQALTYAESTAVADAAERFWASDSQPGSEGWRDVIVEIVGEHVVDAEAG